MLEVKSQANSDDNYTRSLSNAIKLLDINKLDNTENSTNNSNNNLIKPITQPLLHDSTLKIKNINNDNSNIRYIIEKYDENCIDDSKIEYIECLLEEQNKNFFYFLLSIITLGFFALILELYPLLKVKFSYLRANIYNASHFFIKCYDGKYYAECKDNICIRNINVDDVLKQIAQV